MFWSKIFHLLNIKVLLELCEWPLANVGANDKSLERTKGFCNKAILAVDAILPISKYIEERVREILIKHNLQRPIFSIPIFHDIEEYNLEKPLENANNAYILYSCSTKYIDIVFLTVGVLSELKKKQIDIKPKFTGGCGIDDVNFKKIKKYIVKKNLSELIEFIGFLD